jgi:hypothetical protein
VEILDGLADLKKDINDVRDYIENNLESRLTDSVQKLYEASKELKRLE